MWDTVYYQNTGRDWTVALATVLAVFAALLIARALALRHLTSLARRTRTDFDDVLAEALRRTTALFLLLLAIIAGSRTLLMPAGARDVLRIAGVLVVSLQIMLWGTVIINSTIRRQMKRRLEEDPGAATSINALGFVGRLVLYALVLLLALDNLGINITALVTGLGIGGIAVALAVQNILGDLFGSLSIILDRPFVIGDFIVVGEMAGTVEYIGLKTTRIRSLSGEQIVFSNTDLLTSRVRNYRHLHERRVLFRVGVAYETPRSVLEQVPGMLREAVESQPEVRFDRAHFASYGAYSLDFEVVYYVLTGDYNRYMDVQQAINLAIHRRFEDAGVAFAYPTQNLYVQRMTTPASEPAGGRDADGR